MKRLLLFSFILLLSPLAEASHPALDNPDIRPTVFPNPATDFISLSNEDAVQQLVIYHFGGRQVLSFDAAKGQRYDISSLPAGMYLVQFLNPENRIIHTQRLQKR